MTASFLALAWPPFRVCSARPSSAKSPVSTFPRIKPQGAQRTKSSLGHLRTLRADLFELTLIGFWTTACFTITGLPPPFTSGTAFQTVNV